MIWVTWRQQRVEALICGAILIVLAGLILKTGLDLGAGYSRLGVAACLTASPDDQHCYLVLQTFHQQLDPLNTVFSWFEVLPAVLAILVASPTTMELEQGTFRLAWTQSITRTRWITIKLALTLSAVIAGSLAVSVLLSWWHEPVNRLQGGSFSSSSFDTGGLVPVAYAVFAVALGLAAGTVLRRVIPALGIMLAGFLVARLGIEALGRPNYVAPVEKLWTSGPIPVGPRDWLISKGQLFQDRLGHLYSMDQINQLCGNPGASQNISPAAAKDLYISCYNQHGISEVIRYQPADRFWLFQGIESAIFLGMAAALLVFTTWWIRHRIA